MALSAVCCPLQNQRIVCNGHKRVHALKFPPTVTPNGVIANLYGPVCEWKYTCIQKVIIKLNPLSFPGLSQFSSEGNTNLDHIDETWSADLVDMQSFNKWNKGYRYLLMVIDVFSIYG